MIRTTKCLIGGRGRIIHPSKALWLFPPVFWSEPAIIKSISLNSFFMLNFYFIFVSFLFFLLFHWTASFWCSKNDVTMSQHTIIVTENRFRPEKITIYEGEVRSHFFFIFLLFVSFMVFRPKESWPKLELLICETSTNWSTNSLVYSGNLGSLDLC